MHKCHTGSREPALCLPSFRPPAPDTPLQLQPHTAHAVVGPGHLDFTPSRPCACNLHALTPTCPSGPGDHTPHFLVTRHTSSSARMLRSHALTTPPHLAPPMPLPLSHLSHGARPCATHVHLLFSSPAPYDWQEVMQAGLLKRFASGTAPELDLAPLGQAGGGSSLETTWTLPTPAPDD